MSIVNSLKLVNMRWVRVEWESIQVGEWVLLKYKGHSNRVPKWLGGTWAKVLRRNKAGNLVVQSEGELVGYTRTVQKIDIVDHMKTRWK